jgi:tetratricopeptide (TPR) repeat protein
MAPEREAEIRSRRGWAYLQLDRVAEAKADFEWIIKHFPEQTHAHHDRAVCLLRQGDMASAIREWQRLIDADPGFIDAYEKLSTAYTATGQSQQCISIATEGLKIDPLNGSLLLTRALEHLKAHDFDAALVDANRALELDAIRVGSPLAALYFVRGYALMAKKQFAAAEGSLHMAIMLDRTKAQYKATMCHVQCNLNRFNLALALAYNIEGSPEVRSNIVMLGSCAIAFFKGQDYEKAAEFVDLVLAKSPADSVMLGLAGLVALGREDYAAARKHLEKSLEVNARGTSALGGLAIIFAFDPEEQRRDLPRALECAQRRCEVSQDDPASALAILGFVQIAHGNLEEAGQTLRQCLDAAGDHSSDKRATVERYVRLLDLRVQLDNSQVAADARRFAL